MIEFQTLPPEERNDACARKLASDLRTAVLSFERATYYPLSKSELNCSAVESASWIRETLNDLRYIKRLEEHGPKWRNKIEVFFNHWAQKETDEATEVQGHLLNALKILSGNNAEQQISPDQYDCVMSNSIELRKAWGGKNADFHFNKEDFTFINSHPNGGSVFLSDINFEGKNFQRLFFFPHIYDFDTVVRGALNTHGFGTSGSVPGALSCLTAFPLSNFDEGKLKRAVHLQGLYRTHGPFSLDASQFKRIRRYSEHQVPLAEAFLEYCFQEGVSEIVLRTCLQGGNRNEEYLRAACDNMDSKFQIKKEGQELILLAA